MLVSHTDHAYKEIWQLGYGHDSNVYANEILDLDLLNLLIEILKFNIILWIKVLFQSTLEILS